MDERTKKNSLIWAVVLLIEAIILKLAKKPRLWFFIALPILAGFLLTSDILKPKPKKKRNLK